MPHLIYLGDGARTWQEAVIAGALDGVLLVDGAARIVEMNAAAEQLFRVRRRDALGLSVQAFVPVRFRERHAAEMDAFFETALSPRGMADRGRVQAVRANGEEFMAEIALIPVRVDGAVAVACIVRDVAERLQMEAALVRAEKLESLRLLSAGLAHDFNNILSAVIGNAEFALQFAEEGSPERLALHDIKAAGLRAAEMVQQMLRFAGRTETTRVPVDLTVVAREMLQMLRGALAPTVVAQTEFAPEPVEVMADVVGVRQVLMNLVVNASEAMAERGGRLLVRTGVQDVTARYLRACQRQTCHGSASARPGSYAYVEVADTGKGMDAATRERIFDPFFSTKFAGRGLGLASVLGVVEAHQGVIHVSSRPGRGTTFRVLFPREGG